MKSKSRQAIEQKRRPLWLISVFLVATSICGVWLVLEANRTTETYLVAIDDLATGSSLTQTSVGTLAVSLFGLSGSYLKQGELTDQSYLIRPLSSGELIPKSAVTSQLLDDQVNLVISTGIVISSELRAGSKIQLWTSPFLEYGKYGEPYILALDSEIVEIKKPEGAFVNQAPLVEIRIPIESLQAVLQSIANQDSLAVISTAKSVSQ
jgi:hypothetical protein